MGNHSRLFVNKKEEEEPQITQMSADEEETSKMGWIRKGLYAKPRFIFR
jgi:hypothetical protein